MLLQSVTIAFQHLAQMNSLVLGGIADVVGMEILFPGAAPLCSALVAILALSVPTLRRLDV